MPQLRNWGKWVPGSWGSDLDCVPKLLLLNRCRINIIIYIWYFSLLSIEFLKFCMVYAYVKALVVPSFKYPNFWPHFKRNLFLEKLEKIASRTRKGKKPNKTVDQAQFHRGLLLLILEGDSSVNYTSDDGIAVSKFHTLKSSVNWVITPRLLALYCEVK